MTDVADWSGVSFGGTTLVTSGTLNFPAGGQENILFTGVPSTTRSLLLLMVNGSATVNAAPNNLIAIGSGTGLRWFQQATLLGANGASPVLPGQSFAPIYLPWYGLVDGTGDIELSAGLNVALEYWLLALPDADILGTRFNPITVVNPEDTGIAQTGGAPILVTPAAGGIQEAELVDGAGVRQGTASAPLFVESPALTQVDEIDSGYTNTTVNQPICGATAPGQTRRVKKMALYTFGASTGSTLCTIVGHTSGVTYHALSLNNGSNGESHSDAVFNVSEGLDVHMSSANGLYVVALVVSQVITLGT